MTVFHQRLVVLAVFALSACALVAPGTAAAAITGCSTQVGQSTTAEGVVQHNFSRPAINMTDAAKASSGNLAAATLTVTCTGDTTAPAIGMPLMGPGLSKASGALSVSSPNIANLTSSYVMSWHPNSSKVATDKKIDDMFVFAITEGDGLAPEQVVMNFSAVRQYDLSVDVTMPSSVDVLTSGTDVTYTGTVTNAGPDPAPNRTFYWELANDSTAVSANPTCGSLNFFPPAQTFTCQAGTIASGATKTFLFTVRYTPGVKGLALPATTDVLGTFSYKTASGDLNEQNDVAKKPLSLVAATCPTGTTGTPPNCVKPKPPASPAGPSGAANVQMSTVPSNGNDRLFGTSFADVIRSFAGNDIVNGGAGDDVLDGGAGDDRLAGGAGNDKIGGSTGDDKLFGGAGSDSILCGTGDDITSGGAGRDTIRCRDGHGGDVLSGGAGRDTCIGDATDKFISCERIKRY